MVYDTTKTNSRGITQISTICVREVHSPNAGGEVESETDIIKGTVSGLSFIWDRTTL